MHLTFLDSQMMRHPEALTMLLWGSLSPVWGFPCSLAGKESSCNAGDPSSIPGSGGSPGEGIVYPLQYSWASLLAQTVKNPPIMQETWVWSPGWEDPQEKGMATHSSILGWRSPWTEELGRLQSMGSQSQTQLNDFRFHFPHYGKSWWFSLGSWICRLSSKGHESTERIILLPVSTIVSKSLTLLISKRWSCYNALFLAFSLPGLL